MREEDEMEEREGEVGSQAHINKAAGASGNDN